PEPVHDPWSREEGSNPHGLRPDRFWDLRRPDTNGHDRSRLEHLQQRELLEIVVLRTCNRIPKLIMLAQNRHTHRCLFIWSDAFALLMLLMGGPGEAGGNTGSTAQRDPHTGPVIPFEGLALAA